MSNIRKLSAFRQLSLNCDPTPEQRRKTFKKQYSEDLPDNWGDIKISLNSKLNRNFDQPPQIKIAWEENTDLKTEEAVIIKKCKEVRRASTGKLSRQSSLEKESILHSKQEITERLRQHVNETKEKEQEKTNLKIFLAQNSVEQNYIGVNKSEKEPPKLIQPLLAHPTTNRLFKIHRNRFQSDPCDTAYSPTRSKDASPRPNAIVVVPIVDKHVESQDEAKNDIKPIDSIIIRPVTAATKRERFQKRSNSAFTSIVGDSPARPTLIRSSSATVRPERSKSKFVATKRKIRSAKRPTTKIAHHGDLEGGTEENHVTVTTAEIVTMVSLVSPAGSDVEEEVRQEEKKKEKSKSKGGKTKEEMEVQKNMSLRKTVKTVSFQQSSIHAVRSFSASFPARRGSMATAITLGGNARAQASKMQEKRSTDIHRPDDDERVPKRRLVGNRAEEKVDSRGPQEEPLTSPQPSDEEEKPTTNANITVDIKTKDAAPEMPKSPTVGDVPEMAETTGEPPVEPKQEAKYESPKERQCWELHRKMTEKGINVSLDTILRGILTPTEYRLSRQNSLNAAVEEVSDADENTN